MAIEPINLPSFSRNPVGVEAILARGGSAFGSILRDAVQLGRDQSNLQAAQERDLITEQRREMQLKERRGDAVVAQLNADRRFGEDQRQFNTKFGEGVRQFDTGVIESGMDRALRVRDLDLQAEGLKETIRQGGARTEIEREKLNTNKEDLTFRRNEAAEAKTQKAEIYKIDLETAKLRLKDAQGKEAQDAAKQAYAQAQAAALGRMDEILKSGDTEAAKSYFNTTIERYDFDPGTKSRLAKQLGIEAKSGNSEAGAKPLESLSDEELERKRKILEDSVAPNGPSDPKDTVNPKVRVEKVPWAAASELSAIRQEQERRKAPPYLNNYKQ